MLGYGGDLQGCSCASLDSEKIPNCSELLVGVTVNYCLPIGALLAIRPDIWKNLETLIRLLNCYKTEGETPPDNIAISPPISSFSGDYFRDLRHVNTLKRRYGKE